METEPDRRATTEFNNKINSDRNGNSILTTIRRIYRANHIPRTSNGNFRRININGRQWFHSPSITVTESTREFSSSNKYGKPKRRISFNRKKIFRRRSNAYRRPSSIYISKRPNLSYKKTPTN